MEGRKIFIKIDARNDVDCIYFEREFGTTEKYIYPIIITTEIDYTPKGTDIIEISENQLNNITRELSRSSNRINYKEHLTN